MTTTADLLAVAVTALTNATDAGANIFSVRNWPTWSGDYPIIFIRTPEEEKESLGRHGPPQFTTTATLTVLVRSQAPASGTVPFDSGALDVETELNKLKQQIEVALINYPALTSLIQQFPFVRSRMTITSEGEQHLGELVVEFGLEFFQGPDDFYQAPSSPLTDIELTVQEPNGTTEPGLSITLPQ